MFSPELMYAALVHLKQEFPEFAHLNDWQGITEEDIGHGIVDKMKLVAGFCAKCPTCQAIKKQIEADMRAEGNDARGQPGLEKEARPHIAR